MYALLMPWVTLLSKEEDDDDFAFLSPPGDDDSSVDVRFLPRFLNLSSAACFLRGMETSRQSPVKAELKRPGKSGSVKRENDVELAQGRSILPCRSAHRVNFVR